ncbi:MAG TPA: hypothetical protein VEB20_02100 [Azospirillaceae bacterium]|nr:hypothetical protein [Azospirillaceae bacterium]
MIDGPTIVAVLMSLVSLLFFMERAWRRVQDGRRRARMLINKRTQQVERIKKAATATLMLKRDLRRQRETAADIEEDCLKLEGQIQTVARPENRLFVLEERRVPSDLAWVVTVTGKGGDERGSRPWTSRKFLVWAADEDGARAKAERRFQPANGFSAAAITPWIKPAPKQKRAS